MAREWQIAELSSSAYCENAGRGVVREMNAEPTDQEFELDQFADLLLCSKRPPDQVVWLINIPRC